MTATRYLGLRRQHWLTLRSLLRQTDRLEQEMKRAFDREAQLVAEVDRIRPPAEVVRRLGLH